MKKNHTRSILSLAAICLSIVCASTSLTAQEASPEKSGLQAQLERAAEIYTPASWTSSQRRAGVALGELKFSGYTAEPMRHADGRLEVHFGSEDGLAPFVVEAQVCETAKQAHQFLLGHLAHLSSPRPATTATELSMDVGDAGYVGLSGGGPGAISWIAFVRANIYVRLLAGAPDALPQPDLAAVAQSVDTKIVMQPALADGAPLPHPRILQFAASKSACVAGEILTLDLSVDNASGEFQAFWTVGGPGQGYVEKREDNIWRLYTTGPGAISLRATVVGKFGTTASKTIEIEVADD